MGIYFQKFTWLLMLILPGSTLSGQIISGTISDGTGTTLPYTHVYVPQLKKGTTSNVNGIYSMALPSGNWKIEFRNLGYNTLEQEVELTDGEMQLDVVLRERSYRIGEIKILASGEDPAVYIMRRAIAMAPYYKSQVSEYSSTVYLKGSGKFARIPRLLRKTLEKQGIRANDVFSMESLSKVEFRLPDQLKQQVLAQRSSGNDNNTSPMPMVTSDLYNASRYGVISPFDRQALQVYTFRLLGMFEDQGRMINRIQVTPRRKGNDVFDGIINVADGYWSVHSADLKLAAPMMQIRMKQLYGPVDINTWMPVSLSFDVQFEGMGFGLDYVYVASVSDYQVRLNPGLDHNFIEKQRRLYAEEMQVMNDIEIRGNQQELPASSRKSDRMQELLHKDELNNRESRELNRLLTRETASTTPPPPLEIEQRIFMDSMRVDRNPEFWDTLRPIPLTPEETRGFQRKDSLMVIQSAPAWRDSVELARKRFKPQHIVLGATYSYHPRGSNTRKTFSIPGLVGGNMLSFNTVDGIRVNLPFRWYTRDTLGHAFTFAPEMAYAVARRKADFLLASEYTWNGRRRATAGISGGSSTVDYNRFSGMPLFANEFHTLWYERNYKKFFRRDFVEIFQQIELVHGLNLKASFSWADRQPLANHSNYRIIDWKDRSYAANIPQNPTLETVQLLRSRSAEASALLTWNPRQRFFIRNGFKYYAESRYPTLSLRWRKAIPGFMNTTADFDYLEAGIQHRLNPGIGSILDYGVNAGGFLTNRNLHFSDFRHFTSHFPWLIGSPAFDSFGLNPFYRTSTSGLFAEAHASYESGRILVKRIPALGNTLITEQLFVNLMHTSHYPLYSEIGYRIKNIFAVISVEGVAAFRSGRFDAAGAKLIVQFPGTSP
jgi:hypothetical protein